MLSGLADGSAHFSVHCWLYFATTKQENEARSQPVLHHPFIGERRSGGGRSSVFNKSINHPAAQALVGMAPGLWFHLMWPSDAERITELFLHRTREHPEIETEYIHYKYKNNSDIGYPWIQTWRLCWINAQTFLLTSTSSSHPWDSFAFNAQKGNPRLPVVMENWAWAHVHVRSFIINRVCRRADPC